MDGTHGYGCSRNEVNKRCIHMPSMSQVDRIVGKLCEQESQTKDAQVYQRVLASFRLACLLVGFDFLLNMTNDN